MGTKRLWKILLLVGTAALLLPWQTVLPAGGLFELEVPAPSGPPMVALTFDDGPRTDATADLLDQLALREVQATFFLVGHRLAGREELVRRMAAEGHQIGVHSYTHIPLTGLSRAEFDREVGQTRQALTTILGEGDYWLRPPYGFADSSVRAWADSPILLWSVDTEDWKDKDVARMVDTVVSQVSDGDIILFHDIYQTSVEAAIQVVDELLNRGYTFATAEQLLEAKGVSAEKGKIYRKVK